jgi:hypothetical protein
VKKKGTTSPLVDAATAFDDELREYAKLAKAFLDSSLGTAKQLERVEETLGLIAACEERLTVTGQGLANAVSAARDEQERTAQAMLDHLPVVRERTELLKTLFAQFQALGAEAGALNQDTAKGGGPSALRDLAARVGSLAERAEAVAAQSREAGFGDLASQAHALAQQLAAAHKKLAGATL